MTETQIIATLRAKRHDVEASIKAYDAKLQQARRDLAHVTATLALFASDEPGRTPWDKNRNCAFIHRRIRKAHVQIFAPGF